MEAFLILIPIFVALAVLFRVAVGGMDHDRIRDYVESRGGQVLDSSWAPFGPGWFGEKSDRIYLIHYLDADGNEHEAHCKTSMLTGVYFTEDRIVAYAEQPPPVSLEEENRRLREEVERLRRGGRGV